MSVTAKDFMRASAQPELTRGQRIWNRLRDQRDEGMLSLARAKSLTASYQETEGLPTSIRRAKAVEKILAEMPIYIDEGQLLVGDFAARPMWAEWYPEFAVNWVLKELGTGEGFFRPMSSEIGELREICKYWESRSVESAYLASLNEEEKRSFMEMGEDGAWVTGISALLDRPGGYHVVSYDKLIREGCLGILNKVEEELRATSVTDDE